MRVLGFVALLIALDVGGLVIQNRAAARLCDPMGTTLADVDAVEGTALLTARGPLPDPERPGVESVIYCSALPMCDTVCTIEVRDGAVIRAELSSL